MKTEQLNFELRRLMTKKGEIKIFLELSESENTVYQNFWDIVRQY
jgi:hypothetical protein